MLKTVNEEAAKATTPEARAPGMRSGRIMRAPRGRPRRHALVTGTAHSLAITAELDSVIADTADPGDAIATLDQLDPIRARCAVGDADFEEGARHHGAGRRRVRRIEDACAKTEGDFDRNAAYVGASHGSRRASARSVTEALSDGPRPCSSTARPTATGASSSASNAGSTPRRPRRVRARRRLPEPRRRAARRRGGRRTLLESGEGQKAGTAKRRWG